jgi:hypothetical protein
LLTSVALLHCLLFLQFKGQVPPVGAWAEVDHAFSQEAVNSFAATCGDDNPLHTDPQWAKVRGFVLSVVCFVAQKVRFLIRLLC